MENYTDRTNLVVITPAMPVSLDPVLSNDIPSSRVRVQIFETLVNLDDKSGIIPGLAESWEFINSTTLTFALKKGVKFHNGEELKAQDVEFSLKRAIGSPHCNHLINMISDVVINDDYNLTIKLREPFAPILSHMVHSCIAIVSKAEIEKIGDEAHGKNPIGTGPFKFNKWTVRKFGERIELSRFDEYHGKLPLIQNVIIKSVREHALRISEIELGTADIIYDVPFESIPRIETNKHTSIVKSDNFSICYIGFNCLKEPFTNPKVRLAISHGIFRESIIKRIFKGDAVLSAAPLPPKVWGSAEGKLKPIEYDVEKAKALLKEAGYEKGFKTSICLGDRLERTNIAKIIQSHLKALNIDCEIRTLGWTDYVKCICEGNTEMLISDWVTVTGDADYGLYSQFHSSNFGGGGNYSFYSNPKIDKLLECARQEMNHKLRLNNYFEAQKIVCEDAPWLFLQQGEDVNAARTNVKGFKNHPAGYHELRNVYFE